MPIPWALAWSTSRLGTTWFKPRSSQTTCFNMQLGRQFGYWTFMWPIEMYFRASPILKIPVYGFNFDIYIYTWFQIHYISGLCPWSPCASLEVQQPRGPKAFTISDVLQRVRDDCGQDVWADADMPAVIQYLYGDRRLVLEQRVKELLPRSL